MGWHSLQHTVKNLLIQPFYILTINILTQLIPLSFLVLARISCAQYLLTIISYPEKPSHSFFFSVCLYNNPAILYILVSTVSIATLIHGLTGTLNVPTELPGTVYRPRLYTAWIFLCLLQVCVGLGMEGSIAAGVDGPSFGIERSLLSRVIFFLGLHDTMLLWYRMVVKPVVDDTIFYVSKEESLVDKVAMALSFGGFWWWKLRDEVEAFVVLPEVKKEMLMSVALDDFVGWWLYYLTVTVGMVRVVKALLWLAIILLCRRRETTNSDDYFEDDQDKV